MEAKPEMQIIDVTPAFLRKLEAAMYDIGYTPGEILGLLHGLTADDIQKREKESEHGCEPAARCSERIKD
jgi:hypothetical protein